MFALGCGVFGGRCRWEGEVAGKRGRKMSKVQIMHTHVTAKMLPVETVPGMEGGG
jgi:hypothetical protein